MCLVSLNGVIFVDDQTTTISFSLPFVLQYKAAVMLPLFHFLAPQILPPRLHSPHWLPTHKATSRCGGATMAAGCPADPGPPPWWTIRATDTRNSLSGEFWSSQRHRVWPLRSRSLWRAFDMSCSPIRSTWRKLYAVPVL